MNKLNKTDKIPSQWKLYGTEKLEDSNRGQMCMDLQN